MPADIRIHCAGPEHAREWDRFVLNHPMGLGYQLFGWGQAVQKAYGFEPVYLMARSGRQLQGVLPLVDMGLPFGRSRLVSLPYCDAAGILARSKAAETALLDSALALGRNRNGLSLRSITPLPGVDPALTRNPEKVRLCLDLPGTESAFAASLKSKVRSQAQKPARDGLTFELGGVDLVHAFYRVFKENMRDLGSPVHSLALISKVLKHLGARAHIGVVRLPDREPAAAGIILCHPRTVSIPWASSLRRFNAFNPNMMLYWHLIRTSIALGAQRFDFGRSTPREGTFRFKQQWGARPFELHWAEFDRVGNPDETSGSVTGGRLRSQVARLISAMPLSPATWAGSRLRKYISL